MTEEKKQNLRNAIETIVNTKEKDLKEFLATEEVDITGIILKFKMSEQTHSKIITEKMIEEFLQGLGFAMHTRAYKYIKKSISLVAEDTSYLNGGITKRLYPDVARYFGTTPIAAERVIRYGIETALQQRPTIINETFKSAVRTEKGKIVNSEFIAEAIELLNK